MILFVFGEQIFQEIERVWQDISKKVVSYLIEPGHRVGFKTSFSLHAVEGLFQEGD